MTLRGPILAMELDAGRWFWSPGYGASLQFLIIVGVVVVLVFALGSTTWRRATGPVAPAEDAMFFRRTRLPWLVLILSLAGLAYPWTLFLAVAGQVFPPGERSTLLLVGRGWVSHPDPSTGADQDFVAWKARAQTGKPGRLMDAGPVVDRVLKQLSEAPPALLLPENKEALKAKAAELVTAETARVPLDTLRRASAGDAVPAAGGAPSVLPAWLVESVEFAALRLLTERVNIARILVLSAGRCDETGRPAWRGFRDYLQSAEHLTRTADDAVWIFNDGKGITYPELLSASSFEQSAAAGPVGAHMLLLSVAMPPAAGAAVHDEVTFVGKFRSSPPGTAPPAEAALQNATLERKTTASTQIVRIPLAAGAQVPGLVYLRLAGTVGAVGPAHKDVEVGSVVGHWNKTLRMIGPGWTETCEKLTPGTGGASADSWWFDQAAKELFDFPGPLNGAILKNDATAADDDLVIDGTVSSHGILIYKKGAQPPPAVPPPAVAPVTAPGAAVWSRQYPPNAVFALAGAQWRATAMAVWTGTAGTAGALGSALQGQSPIDGLPPHRPGLDSALLTVAPDPRPGMEDYSLVWIGVNPASAGLLYAGQATLDATPPGAGQMTAAAFWGGVLCSAKLCLSPPPSRESGPSDTNELPAVLLTDADIGTATGQAHAASSLLLVGSLIVAGIWGVAQAFLYRSEIKWR